MSRTGGPNSITTSTANYVYQLTSVQQGICRVVSNYDYEDFDGVHHPLGIVSELNVSGQSGGTGGCGNTFGIVAVPFGGDQHYKAIGHDASLDPSATGFIVDNHGDSAYNRGSDQSGFSFVPTAPGAFLWPSFEDTNGNFQNGSGRPGSFNGFGAIGGMESGIRPQPGSYSVSFPGSIVPYVYTVQNVSSTYAMGYRDVTPPALVGAKDMCGRQPVASNISNGSFTATPISFPVVTLITLPDNLFYQLSYDQVFGLISKITYPTGAWVQYTWDVDRNSEVMGWMTPPAGIPNRYGELFNMSVDGGNTTLPYNSECYFTHDKPVIRKRIVSYDGVTPAEEQDFQYSTQWENGGDPTFWAAKTTTVTTKDLIRPGQPADTTIYNYIPRVIVPAFGSYTRVSPMPLEDTIVYIDASGKTVKTVKKVWTNTSTNEDQLVGECTILDDGSVKGVFYKYLPYSWPDTATGSAGSMFTDILTDVAEYDYGTVSASCVRPSATPTRETLTTYASFPNSPLWPTVSELNGMQWGTVSPQYMIDRPATVKVYDNGTLAAETDYTYDEGSVAGVSSAVGHDETNFGAGSANPRGNPTTIRKKCFQGSSPCTDAVYHVSYDSTGQPVSVIDANGNTTQISYDDNYTGDDGSPSGNTNTYVTQIKRPATNGVQHIQKFQWDYLKGELRVATDENGQKTAYFYNDPWNRLTEADYPDGGKANHQYSDAGPNPSVVTTQLVAAGVTRQDKSVMDGFGNVIQTILQSDPEGAVYRNTAYDGLGRLYLDYNPSRSSSSSDVVQYTYDALGRTTSAVQQDLSTISTQFSGPCATTTDEVGHQRKSCSDAFGRLTSVTEDLAGRNYLTKYNYDALNDLLCVEQHGDQSFGTGCSSYPTAYSPANPWRVRQFFYNSLGRLTKSQNPETGSIAYGYDGNGNVTSKGDDRGVTIQYTPDSLNRVTQKTYTDGTAAVSYSYDSGQNAIGRLSSSSTADGVTQSYSYDVMGRINSSTQCLGGNCASINAQWTYVGALAWLSYPSSRNVKYSYDSAGRIGAVILDSFNNNSVNYPYYAVNQSNGYWPSGLVRTAQFGNGLYEFTHQNNRLQVDGFTVSKSGSLKCGGSSGANLLQLGLSFVDPSTGKNDGNVAGVIDYVNPNWSMNFTYDGLDRIISATEADNAYMQTFTPDAFGNITQDGSFRFVQAFLPNNQLSGYCYDAVGNLLDQGGCQSSGIHAYQYDAENRIFSTQEGATFTYDAGGSRVLKNGGTGTTEYFYFGGLPIAELNNGTWSDYIFGGSKRIAISTSMGPSDSTALIPATGTSYFHGDQLGSSRLMTSGTVLTDQRTPPYAMYAPLGQLIRGDVPSHYKFTGKERDSETGLDYFGARYYASNMGRWMSPDWSASAEPVPYADLSDPQTLNLYGYVRNNPLSKADADGHDWDDFVRTVGGAVNAYNQANGFNSPQPLLENNLGRMIGTGAAALQGSLEMIGGAGMTATGVTEMVATAPTGVLPVAGAAVAATGVVVSAHGTAVLGNAINMMKDSSSSVREGQREAMRQEGIPTSQQPSSQKSTEGGRQYTYEVPKSGGGTETKIVTRNHADRSHPGQKHIEAGRPKPNGQTDSLGRLRHTNDKTKVNVN